MTQEEILLRVGLDGSGFDSNLAKSTTSLERFAERGHNSFVHVERPARAFHHLLGEIGGTLPLLSEGLSALINPTTGIIALVGAGFAAATEKIKEFNKNLDEISEHNAKGAEVNKRILEDQKSLNEKLSTGLIPATTEAVLAEKDPFKRIVQARQLRDRLARERDEKQAQADAATHTLSNVPGLLTLNEQAIKDLEKAPLSGFTESGMGLPIISSEAAKAEKERQLTVLRDRSMSLRSRLGKEGELSARREALNKEVSERAEAVKRLDLTDQEFALTMLIGGALPEGQRKLGRGAAFSSVNPFGIDLRTPVGQMPGLNDIFVKELISFLASGQAKVQVPNGK